MRKVAFTVVATVLAVGCSTPTPETPTPSPSPSERQLSPAATAEPDLRDPAPTSLPSRDVVVGGRLSVALADETVPFEAVQCDLAGGLTVVASAPNLTAVSFSVDDAGLVTDVVVTLPSGTTGLVNHVVGSAEFSGGAEDFRVSGQAATLAAGAQGDAALESLLITGTCAPGDG